MIHLNTRHFTQNCSYTDKLTAKMEWTYCVIWFLCFSVSKCWQPPDSESFLGEVQSPQYPRPYPPNLLRQWDLWVAEGYQIQLSLTHLDIKASSGCLQDSLMVLYDQKVLGKFCGQENSTDHPGKEPILSRGNKLTLIFQTSNSTPELQQHIGFSGSYKGIDIDECSRPDPGDGSGPLCSQICINTRGSYRCSCHYGYELHSDQHTCVLSCGGCIFDKSEGHLSSPGYPHPSPPSLSCKYIISVEPRLNITLNFTDNFHIGSMDTDQGSRCLRHWLQVTIPDREPFKLCGEKSPGVIVTTSNTVRLDYHTDDESLSLGWSLDYNTYVIDCGEPEPLLNGGVTLVSGFQNLYGSVVQYHCNEPFYSLPKGVNGTVTCEADRKWRSKHNNVTPTCIPVCGRPTKLISTYQRIMGGSDAPDDTIPWQVLLIIDGRRVGGMVIADRWIMTTAHNVVHDGNNISSEAIKIHMGHNDIKPPLGSPMLAASVHIHPEYNNPNNLDYNNDIALITLKDPIMFNSSVMPICLPAEGAKYTTGVMGMVSGFGITTTGTRSKKLRYVQVPVVDQDTCRNSFISETKTWANVPTVTDNMFCAGVPEGGKDSCGGDGGGAYALRDDGQFWAAGIVSWGFQCGKQGVYGFYTRVDKYVDWINKTMQEN